MKVLLIDDSAIMRMMLASLLNQVAPCDVTEAADGQDGIEWLNRARFDLVLLDLHMPGMDGMEFLRYRQTSPALLTVPVIVISSDAEGQQMTAAEELGASAYVTKPFTFSGLRTALSAAMPDVQLVA